MAKHDTHTPACSETECSNHASRPVRRRTTLIVCCVAVVLIIAAAASWLFSN